MQWHIQCLILNCMLTGKMLWLWLMLIAVTGGVVSAIVIYLSTAPP